MKTLQKVIVMLALPLLYFLVTAAFKSPEMFKSSEVLKNPDVTNIVKTNASNPPVIVQEPKDFRHYILNYGYWNTPTAWEIQNNWSYFHDSLSYNAVHMYDFESQRTGLFDISLSPNQVDTVNGLINNAISHGLAPLLQRSKIAKICTYGQSILFEAEGGNDGYSFSQRFADPISDSGRSVVKGCVSCPPSMPAGMLCENISENIQPCAIYTYPWDPTQNFHLKPEMRIDSAIVDSHPDWPVVAIVSVNFSGQRIDSTVIKAKYFRDLNDNYGGQYLNNYNFGIDPFDLEISGSRTNSDGLIYGFDPKQSNQQQSQINFRIYWFGQVDVWFDQMTVQNDIGNKLFSPDPQFNLNSRLNDELSHFADRMDVFFVDECVYANLPCIKYVQDYIRTYNQQNGTNTKLSYATSNWLNRYYTKNQNNTFKLYLDKTLPQIFQLDAHCFTFDDAYNPGYIPVDVFDPLKLDSHVPDSWETHNKDVYNNYLQNALGNKNEVGYPSETGSLIYQINQSRTQLAANSPLSRFTIQPQIQGWLVANGFTNQFRYGNREPLNQEISAEAWIALAYGADNLNWFWFPSYGLGIGPPPADVSRIMPGDNAIIPGDTVTCSYGIFTNPTQPRTQNLYGQNKYAF